MKQLNEYIRIINYPQWSNDELINYCYEDYICDNNEFANINDYLDKKFIGRVLGEKIDRYRYYQTLLYESILKSYDSRKLAEKLNKLFKTYIYKIEQINSSDIVNSLRITFDIEFDNINKKYVSLLNLFNYYESTNNRNESINKQSDSYVITLSPRISEDMTNEVYNKSNGIVYHICPKYVTALILKNGLRPKGEKNSKIYKNRINHPKSIYVIFGTIDINTKKYFQEQIDNDKISNQYDDSLYKADEYDILEINLNKYDRKLKFYKDTLGGKNFVYTKEYIPAYCISIYKENKLKSFIDKLFK